ncbi:calmodulin-interacting protein 111-like [Dorcoceras hygrometricum]|uniref:Calmodulin-interacting protein 111-like n=1 Tax=Dorcoceras hygrometricum TaxID=472368 RepID=A0A2Z7CNN3_9LAMI|nr:calmodulin-interacting protein 111-like [Dorcoceras hygrometricum]
MPSKKKNSKASSPSPSAVSSSKSSPLHTHDEDFSSYLHEASAKFPSFIAESAFVGRIVEGNVSDSRGCKLWLSESAMISGSIPPGSVVSVSLPSVDKVPVGNSLADLSYECARHFGFDYEDNFSDEVGRFFALATAFPSSKVLKDGVHLSSSLLCTLGCPDSGRTVFVNPVEIQQLTENGIGKPAGLSDGCFSSEGCKELHLSLVCLKSKLQLERATSSQYDLSMEVGLALVENDKISSPKTPFVSLPKVSSPGSVQSHMPSYKKLASKAAYISHDSMDILDMKEVLEDDSSRKLIETCTTSWLCSRILLLGNFVIIPILSRKCVFRVVGAERLSSVGENLINTNNGSATGVSELCNDVVCAFSVARGTKVRMLLPRRSMVGNSVTSSPTHPELRHGCNTESMGVSISKLGGLSEEFTVLKDIIISSTVKGSVASLGLRPTKGVLLHGPPGTGKTTLARLCANDAGVNLLSVSGPEIFSQYQGESEQALDEVFNKATLAVPAVIFIDELDAIAPARKDGGDQVSQRVVATLLNLMDGMSRTDGILVVAATNRPDSIEPALRRPGRLDREIEIGVPSPRQRYEILLALLSEMQHSLSDKDVQTLSMATHGFVGADLAALCNQAALVCLQRFVSLNVRVGESDFKISKVANYSVSSTSSHSHIDCLNSDLDICQVSGDSVDSNLEACFSHASEIESSSDFMDGTGATGAFAPRDDLKITSEDFERARDRVRPSAMREVVLEVPKVSWEDVGGQKEVKMQLMEAVEWPQKNKDAFERIGTRPPTGILLFGPPGCSKTLLARAVASEAGLNFLAVRGPELFSKWVGESEKAVRSLFAKARANAPSIIFFDEFDGLANIRGKESDGVSVGDRVMTQLLVELDGLQQRGSVTVIAATNRPDKIDLALLRPGRFDRLLFVGPPNKKDREDIFRVYLRRMPCSSDVCISELSLLTENCTGADISLICREAGMKAIEESAPEITMEHLKAGIKQVQPSDMQTYDELSLRFQRLVHATSEEDNSICEPISSKQSPIPFWYAICLRNFLAVLHFIL